MQSSLVSSGKGGHNQTDMVTGKRGRRLAKGAMGCEFFGNRDGEEGEFGGANEGGQWWQYTNLRKASLLCVLQPSMQIFPAPTSKTE